MPRTRLTFFYEMTDVGFSESVHTQLTDPVTLTTLVNGYKFVRLPFLIESARMIDVRVSDDDTFRDIIVPVAGLPSPGTFPGRAAAPSSTLLMKLFTTNPTVSRNMFLRGLPATLMDGRVYTPTGLFDSALIPFRALMSGGQFWVNAKDRTQAKIPITGISIAGAVVLGAPMPGVTNGSIVQLLGVPRSVIKQRQFEVTAFVDNQHFTLRGWPAGQFLGAEGFLRRKVNTLYNINATTIVDIGERKVGRPFGLPRGRVAPVR